MDVLTKAVNECEAFRALLIRECCTSEQDAIAVAIAMMQQTEKIFVAIGGNKMAAAQFYGAADRAAGKLVE